MRLALITTVWRRPRLSRAVLDYYVRQIPLLLESGITLSVFAAISLEDPEPTRTPPGIHLVVAPNDDLGEKWNAAARAAASTRPDAVVIVGSDDLLTPDYLRMSQYLALLEPRYYSPDTCFFLNQKTQEATSLRPFFGGAGRIITGPALQLLAGRLWPEGSHERPDQLQHRHFLDAEIPEERLRLPRDPDQESFPALLDIKTGTNRTPFANFAASTNRAAEPASAEILLSRFPGFSLPSDP